MGRLVHVAAIAALFHCCCATVIAQNFNLGESVFANAFTNFDQSTWTAEIGPVWFERHHSARVPIAFDRDTARFSLTTDDLDYGIESGIGAQVRHAINNDWSVEGVYFQFEDQSAAASDTNTVRDLFGFGFVGNANVRNFRMGNEGSDTMSIQSSTDLHNVELNFSRPLTERLDLMAGVRFVNVDESFLWTSDGSHPAQTGVGTYNIDTGNNLWGMQIGGLWHTQVTDNIETGIQAKTGLFLNAVDQQSSLQDANGLVPGGSFSLPYQLNVSDTDVSLASVVQLNWFWKCALTERWSVRAGYDLIFLGGLALAPEQLNVAPTKVNHDGMMLLSGGHVQLAYEPGADFRANASVVRNTPSVRNNWYARGEAVFLDRSRSDTIPLAYISETNFNNFGLTTDALSFQMQPGMRFTIGRAVSRDTTVEGTWTGQFQWSDRATGPFVLNDIEGVGFPMFMAAFTAISEISIDYDSEYQAAGLGVRKRITPTLDLLGGVRYARQNETVTLFGLDAEPPPPRTRSLNIATNNDLLGSAIGGELQYSLTNRISGGVRGEAGLFLNFAKSNYVTNDGAGSGIVGVPASVSNVNQRHRDTKLAKMIELRLWTAYNLTANCQLRANYNFLLMDGLALAPEQLDPFALDTAGRLIAHGPGISLECRR